jgi:hypothetical protein
MNANPSTAGSVAGGPAAAGSGTPAAGGSSGGAAGGSSGGAAAPAATGDFACGPASAKAPAELYTAAAGALLPPMESSNLPCAFGSCHNASKKVAGLELVFGGSLTDLVGKASCQAPNLKLVEAGGGDAALKNSWLYLKLAAPVDGSANLIADPSWGTANPACGQTSGDFGVRMPFSAGADGIGPEKLAVIKEWICAGAPAGG